MAAPESIFDKRLSEIEDNEDVISVDISDESMDGIISKRNNHLEG